MATSVGIVLALLLLVLDPSQGFSLEPQRWTLQDQDGRPWSITLLEQGDPTYSPGLRLRITDRSGHDHLDHRRPLRLRDGAGGAWELTNRSEELVAAGSEALPAGSAQFDLAGLEPSPRAELPLAMAVPLESGEDAQLVAGAATVAALHGAVEGTEASPEPPSRSRA
ncbi:MAG: DUF3122 domain-containing protein [Synechococcaceae cyanobacterium]